MRLFVILLFFTNALMAQEQVFYNGNIFTGETTQPFVEAVAIRGDKIIAVGTTKKVKKALSKNAQWIDLKGNSMLPGFIDSHIHAVKGGKTLISADITGKLPDFDFLKAFAAEVKSNGKAMNEGFFTITGFHLGYWNNTAALSQIFDSPDYAGIPVMLVGEDYHTAWVNTELQKRAGIDPVFIQKLSVSERSLYGLDRQQRFNGLLREEAYSKISALIPPFSDEKMMVAGKAAIQHCNGFGLTAWMDPTINGSLSTYKKLADQGLLTARVVGLIHVDPAPNTAATLQKVAELKAKYRSVPNLTIDGIKIFADGVVEFPGQTAAMTLPYSNSDQRGDLLFDPKDFANLCIAADKAGMIVHVHAIGDRAVTESLNGIEAARKANKDSNLAHSITHLQFVDPKDFKRFEALNVIASMQLIWAVADTSYTNLVQPYIHPYVYEYQYPARSMQLAGTIIAGASDWAVSSANPLEAIYTAETRRGLTDLVLNANERMSRLDMLYAYTIQSAKALRMEQQIGSIKVGKMADLIILDHDIMATPVEVLRDIKVVKTILGGKVVFQQ